MEKNRTPLTVLRWSRDASGYDLSPDRQHIRRRGGTMDEYDLTAIKLPLHRIFAGLAQSVLGPHRPWGLPDLPDAFYDPTAPWDKRRFRDIESALLAFVNKFGFLGSDRWGADAEFEPVDFLVQTQNNLSSFMDAPWNQEKLPEEIFKGPLAGPNLRMWLEPDEAGQLQVRYKPESLYAWMWLRVADDFSDGIRWDGTPCLFCKSGIGRGPRNGIAHRSDTKFCSSNCRVRFSRLSAAEKEEKQTAAQALQRNQEKRR